MSQYKERLKLIEEKFSNSKDNIISLATISQGLSANGKPRPIVRKVDAHYENGVFHVSTYSKSNKMKQISKKPEVSISVCHEWFTACEIGENLGSALDSKNA